MRLEVASTLRGRLRGLLGRKEFDGVLMISPCNDVHTVGMRFDLDIAFATRDGVILESHRRVHPRMRVRYKKAYLVLERKADESRWFESGDRLGLKCMDENTVDAEDEIRRLA